MIEVNQSEHIKKEKDNLNKDQDQDKERERERERKDSGLTTHRDIYRDREVGQRSMYMCIINKYRGRDLRDLILIEEATIRVRVSPVGKTEEKRKTGRFLEKGVVFILCF